MQFPSLNNWKRTFVSFSIAAAAIITLAALPTYAQKTDANPAVTLNQCQNGASATQPAPCGDAPNPKGWLSGSSGPPHAHWSETEYTPYRALFSNLSIATGNVQTFEIAYDVFHGNPARHAIDFLGTYNLTETVAMGNDPCWLVSDAPSNWCNVAGDPDGDSQAIIPVDTLIPTIATNPGQYPTMPTDGQFVIWGGMFITVPGNSGPCFYSGFDGLERRMTCTFTATRTNPVIAWSGHIAWQGDWGAGNSAGNINGNPYHMRLIQLNGQGGNQDLALSANAVGIPAKVTIVKDATALGGVPTYPLGFDFTASALFGPTSFELFDNGIAGANTQISDPINSFGAENAITVTEFNRTGWTLDNIACVGTGFTRPAFVPGNTSTTLTLSEGADVTCTFQNQQLAPSAAPASVSGRVMSASGRGLAGVYITIYNTNSGIVYSTTSNTFGYYTINDLPISDFYVMTASSKRHMFMDASRSFTLDEDMFGVNFVAAEDQ